MLPAPEKVGEAVKMPFGKHKGEEVCTLDLSYIKWLEEQEWTSDALRSECQYEIQRREGEVSSLGRAVKP